MFRWEESGKALDSDFEGHEVTSRGTKAQRRESRNEFK